MSQGSEANTRRIVVGVDMSETGDHALREGMRWCRELPGAELHVATVIPTPSDLHSAKKIDVLSNEIRLRFDQLRGHVQTVCAPPADAEAFTQEIVFHVRLGEPASALHQVAVDVNADLIIVGTHARKGISKMLLGSVAEELIRTARMPVEIAHPKDFTDLRPSDRQEPRRPGEDLRATGLSDRLHLEFVPRTSHISGLI